MTQSKTLTIGALLVLGLILFGKRLAAQISVGQAKLQLGNRSVSGVDVFIALPITNNTGITFFIDGFKGQLQYGPNKIASLEISNSFELEPRQTANPVINARIRFADLSNSLISLLNSGSILQDLEVTGLVRSGQLIIPVNQKISIV